MHKRGFYDPTLLLSSASKPLHKPAAWNQLLWSRSQCHRPPDQAACLCGETQTLTDVGQTSGLRADYRRPGMYGPPRCRKRKVKMTV